MYGSKVKTKAFGSLFANFTRVNKFTQRVIRLTAYSGKPHFHFHFRFKKSHRDRRILTNQESAETIREVLK